MRACAAECAAIFTSTRKHVRIRQHATATLCVCLCTVCPHTLRVGKLACSTDTDTIARTRVCAYILLVVSVSVRDPVIAWCSSSSVLRNCSAFLSACSVFRLYVASITFALLYTAVDECFSFTFQFNYSTESNCDQLQSVLMQLRITIATATSLIRRCIKQLRLRAKAHVSASCACTLCSCANSNGTKRNEVTCV